MANTSKPPTRARISHPPLPLPYRPASTRLEGGGVVLEEENRVYRPLTSSIPTKLRHVYVSPWGKRGRWSQCRSDSMARRRAPKTHPSLPLFATSRRPTLRSNSAITDLATILLPPHSSPYIPVNSIIRVIRGVSIFA